MEDIPGYSLVMVSETVVDMKREALNVKLGHLEIERKTKEPDMNKKGRAVTRNQDPAVSIFCFLRELKNICLPSCITEIANTEGFKQENGIIRLVFATGRRKTVVFLLLAAPPHENHATDCSCKGNYVKFLFGALEPVLISIGNPVSRWLAVFTGRNQRRQAW